MRRAPAATAAASAIANWLSASRLRSVASSCGFVGRAAHPERAQKYLLDHIYGGRPSKVGDPGAAPLDGDAPDPDDGVDTRPSSPRPDLAEPSAR